MVANSMNCSLVHILIAIAVAISILISSLSSSLFLAFPLSLFFNLIAHQIVTSIHSMPNIKLFVIRQVFMRRHCQLISIHFVHDREYWMPCKLLHSMPKLGRVEKCQHRLGRIASGHGSFGMSDHHTQVCTDVLLPA